MKDGYIDFDEYIKQGEPDKREKATLWRTAIGLQAVDGLKTSEYLKDTARKHIEGEIDIDQARELIKTYYQSKQSREPDDDQMQEADKVSANITKILSSASLDFSSQGILALHRRIFEGVFKHAGKFMLFAREIRVRRPSSPFFIYGISDFRLTTICSQSIPGTSAMLWSVPITGMP